MHQFFAIKTIQCRDDASTVENLTLVIAEVKFRRVALSMLLDAAVTAPRGLIVAWQGLENRLLTLLRRHLLVTLTHFLFKQLMIEKY